MYQIEDLRNHTEGLMRPNAQKKNIIKVSHQQKSPPKKGHGTHNVFIQYHIPEKVSTLIVVLMLPEHLLHSMVDLKVIHLPSVYSPEYYRVLQ